MVMTSLEIIKMLHFDKAVLSMNPYFFGNDYEEKGVLVLMKIEDNKDLELDDIEELCFQCPSFESHPDLTTMILFLFDKDNYIYDYTIAGSKYKISRSEIIQYESLLGEKLD